MVDMSLITEQVFINSMYRAGEVSVHLEHAAMHQAVMWPPLPRFDVKFQSHHNENLVSL